MKEYYTQRASGGLLITEGVAISEDGSGWRNAPHITTEAHAEAWRPVVDSVHAAGGVIYLQLWHMGRQAHPSHHPNTKRVVGPSAIKMEGAKAKTAYYEDAEPEVPHALTADEVKATVDEFVNAAVLSKKAGFDGVELHGANGYLLDEFFQSCSNQRDDEYGGSPVRRTRILRDVLDALLASGAYPIERIGLKISPNGAYGGMGSPDNFETFVEVAKVAQEYKLGYLHVMDGLGFGYHNKCPPVTCADLRKVYDGPILANVGLTRDVAEGLIRSGAADLAVFGRLYISNPDLPERFENDWPLADPAPYPTWWGPTGEKGYTDWPTYRAEEKKE
jgi:2,4-dienoyl-CoA reductase-like NADH-dependent reductase (Old Yellow Enzyme family)